MTRVRPVPSRTCQFVERSRLAGWRQFLTLARRASVNAKACLPFQTNIDEAKSANIRLVNIPAMLRRVHLAASRTNC